MNAKLIVTLKMAAARRRTQITANVTLEHFPKKLIDLFDSGMSQLCEFERFLPDYRIPYDREAL
ncbi:MAG: hypothetical protein ACREDM_04585 [Methylocella sp.]